MVDSHLLPDVTLLCHRFGVDLKLEVNPVVDGYTYKNCVAMDFGPVRWISIVGNGLSQGDLYEIALRLAATFPDKILQPQEELPQREISGAV